MQRHNHRNDLAVARRVGRPEMRRTHYSGLRSHPDHEVALRLASVAPSLGGVETLVSEPRWTSHSGLTPGERERQGIGDGFVRSSLGIEDEADIIADIEQALAAARG
jgi:cystathionine beta-lyase/cystathionine gamma-synthase